MNMRCTGLLVQRDSTLFHRDCSIVCQLSSRGNFIKLVSTFANSAVWVSVFASTITFS